MLLITPEIKFALTKSSVRADGVLSLTGTLSIVDGGGVASGSAVLALNGRKSGQVVEYPLERFRDGSIVCSIPLADLTMDQDELVDAFFVMRSGSSEYRQRISWHPEASWIPYPTKFGNLSFKRKAS
jgi:hypothetical protein